MNEILQSPMQTGAEKLTNNGYDITFDHVSFSYAGADKKALNDISFTIESGNMWLWLAQAAAENPPLPA